MTSSFHILPTSWVLFFIGGRATNEEEKHPAEQGGKAFGAIWKYLLAMLLAVMCVLAMPVIAQAANGDYDVNKVLAVEREKREALAEERYRNSERTDTFSFALSSAYLFGMRSMADGGNGESLSLTALIHVRPSDTQKFRFLVGGEIFGFSAAEHAHSKDTKIQSINLVLTGGFSYDFTRKFSVSCLLGYGLIGGSRMREEYAYGGSETDGSMSNLLSFRTNAEYFINRDLSVFLGYRYFYLAPSILTSAVGWDEIETAAHGLELGIKYRF